jgi:hypothetical protein
MHDALKRSTRTAHHLQHAVVTGDAEQAEADHQHAGNGATLEGDVERFIEADGGGLRGTHVGAHRDVHADVAGSTGQHGADDEADGGGSTEENPDHHGKCDADDRNRRVLAVEVGLSPLLHGAGNRTHAIIAGRLGQNPLAGDPAVGDSHHGADQREHQS